MMGVKMALELVYTEVKKKRFYKWKTLNKFLNTKAYQGIEVFEKKNGTFYNHQFAGSIMWNTVKNRSKYERI